MLYEVITSEDLLLEEGLDEVENGQGQGQEDRRFEDLLDLDIAHVQSEVQEGRHPFDKEQQRLV